MARATMEMEVTDGVLVAYLLRIGDDDFSSKRFDDFDRSCLALYDDRSQTIEIKGWAAPTAQTWLLRLLSWMGLCVPDTAGISPAQWAAMEDVFLRHGILRYKFSRARGIKGSKHLYWHRRRWNGNKWIKDAA